MDGVGICTSNDITDQSSRLGPPVSGCKLQINQRDALAGGPGIWP